MIANSRQRIQFHGIVGWLYFEFAFGVFIQRSSDDDALSHRCRFIVRSGAVLPEKASSSGSLTGKTNLLNVPEVGAATAAEHIEVGNLRLRWAY